MGFLGISGKTWGKLGKLALKAAPVVAAPFTGGTSLLALGAGTGALSGALEGGGWKGALLGGGLGAIPGGGGAGAAAGSAAKVGTKQALGTVAKNLGKNIGLNLGMSAAGRFLPGGGGGGGQNVYQQFLPQQGPGQVGGGMNTSGWKGALVNAGLGALGGAGGQGFLPTTPGSRGTPGILGGGPGPYTTGPYNPGAGMGWPGGAGPATQLPGFGGLFGGGGGAIPASPGRPGVATALPGFGGLFGGGVPAAPNAPAQQGPGFWDKWGPAIIQGGAAVGGILGARQAQRSAMKRTPEEEAALTGARGAATGAAGLAGELGGQARSILGESRPYITQPANYYQTLLGGNRAAMTQAVAPGIASVTDIHRGEERALERMGLRGAARDVAAADIARRRASEIAALTTGVQPAAAAALAGLGGNLMGQAQGLYQTGGGLYGTTGNIYSDLLRQGQAHRQWAAEEGRGTGAAIGGFVRDIGEAWPRNQPAPYGLPPQPRTQQPQARSQVMPRPRY
jgi:hypothetical protein